MTTKLTDSQKQTIRIALAKWMGWKGGVNVNGDLVNDWGKSIHNYPASLDSCHVIELKLTDEQHRLFRISLQELAQGNQSASSTAADFRKYTSASAEHRSLALFRALNLKTECPHDTNKDGDCHLCFSAGGCPLKNP